MIRALVAEWLHRRRLFVIGSVLAGAGVLVCIPAFGWVAAVNLAALALVVAIVPGFLFETGEEGR